MLLRLAELLRQQAQVRLLRSLPPPPGTKQLVGGRAARLTDLKHVLRQRAPLAWLVLMGVMCIVLFLVFGSVTLPLKAMVMNLLSIGASFGAIVWIFQDGRLQGVFRYTSVHTVDANLRFDSASGTAGGRAADYSIDCRSAIHQHQR